MEVKGNPLTYDGNGKPVFSGNSGIAFRTYPRCSDHKWERGSWAQYNTLIHDNYVHDTRYEGLYIGTSHNGWTDFDGNPWGGTSCNGGAVKLVEADLIHVEVKNNRIENTGNDAMQVGGSLQSTEISGNRIYNFGLWNDESHASAIQIGASKAVVDSNWIENPLSIVRRTQGLKHGGFGGTSYTNNVVIGAWNAIQVLRNADMSHGAGPAEVPDIYVYNNTFLHSDAQAVYVFCNLMYSSVRMKNNLFAANDQNYDGNGGVTSCLGNVPAANLLFSNINDAGFVDPANNDFSLLSTSPAVNTGSEIPSLTHDYAGSSRTGKPYDYGAYSK